MNHLFLTKKNGERIVVHHQALKEAFPTTDGMASICVVAVRKSKDDQADTFVIVSESTADIEKQLRAISEDCRCAFDRLKAQPLISESV
jgi:hypothetical protein